MTRTYQKLKKGQYSFHKDFVRHDLRFQICGEDRSLNSTPQRHGTSLADVSWLHRTLRRTKGVGLRRRLGLRAIGLSNPTSILIQSNTVSRLRRVIFRLRLRTLDSLFNGITGSKCNAICQCLRESRIFLHSTHSSFRYRCYLSSSLSVQQTIQCVEAGMYRFAPLLRDLTNGPIMLPGLVHHLNRLISGQLGS